MSLTAELFLVSYFVFISCSYLSPVTVIEKMFAYPFLRSLGSVPLMKMMQSRYFVRIKCEDNFKSFIVNFSLPCR